MSQLISVENGVKIIDGSGNESIYPKNSLLLKLSNNQVVEIKHIDTDKIVFKDYLVNITDPVHGNNASVFLDLISDVLFS